MNIANPTRGLPVVPPGSPVPPAQVLWTVRNGYAEASTEALAVAADKVSGRTYRAFWYVPELKRWAKAVEEYYGANGVLMERTSSELESFKLAN